MTSQNLAYIFMNFEGKFSDSDKIAALKQCEKLSDNDALSFQTLRLKSPVTGLLLHAFLGYFGVGRFYKGDIGRGLLYIACLIVVPVVFVFLTFVLADPNRNSADTILVVAFYIFIFTFIAIIYLDCYLIYKGIQKDNFVKFQNFLLLNFRGVR